jgi:hypothetical protein
MRLLRGQLHRDARAVEPPALLPLAEHDEALLQSKAPQVRAYYGGAGIGVEEDLQDVAKYVEHVSSLPGYGRLFSHGLEIDRVDPNGHYAVGNLRIITPTENKRNTRRRASSPFKKKKGTVSA